MERFGQPPRPPQGDASANRMASLWFTLLLVLYIGFIGAATLILGTGELSFEKGIAKLSNLGAAMTGDQRFHNLRDVATNILLFVPLGALAAARIDPDRIRLFSPWLLLGTLVSAAAEFTQSFTDRTPDPLDLFTNSTGYIAGYVLVFIAIRRYGLHPATLLGFGKSLPGDDRVKVARALVFLYICIYGILQLVPFDISVSLTRIHEKLLPGEAGVPKLILDPLFRVRQGSEGILPMLYAVIALIPLAALMSHIRIARRKESIVSPIMLCALFAVIVEICQVFVMSRTTDITDVALAPIGAAIGVVLARGWHRVQGDRSLGHPGDESAGSRVPIIVMAILIYIVFLSFLTWAPYQFESEMSLVLQKVKHDTNWWPFREHFAVRNLATARDLVEETLQYIPLGLLVFLLVSRIRPHAPRLMQLIWVGAACGGLATFLEFSQAFCKGRFIDVTDIVLAASGAVIGGALVRVLSNRPGSPKGPPGPGPGHHGSGQPGPGQQWPGQPGPGQQWPGQPGPGQQWPGQPGPGQQWPGQ